MTRIRLSIAETRPAALPLFCIACGRPAVAHVAKTFSWRPAWSRLVFYLCVLICLPSALAFWLYSLAKTRRMIIEAPLCRRHSAYWAWRNFWFSAPLLVLAAAVITLAVLVMTARIDGDSFALLFVLMGVLTLGWAIGATVIHRTTIRAVEITDESITLEPVSAEFAEMVRIDRLRPRPAGIDVYDPYPAGKGEQLA